MVLIDDDWEHRAGEPLRRLIDAWCNRRELEALAIMLPAYISIDPPGFTEDWPRVLEALYDLRASRMLPDDEKGELERVIVLVEHTVYPR
jgi:hypothetical protein